MAKHIQEGVSPTGQLVLDGTDKIRVGTQFVQTDGVLTANIDSANSIIYLASNSTPGGDPSGTAARVRGWVASGTYASRTTVALSRNLLVLEGRGYNGTSYQGGASVTLGVDSSGTVSATSMPGRISFGTTADGSNSVTERMTINNAGLVTINNGLTVSSGTVTIPSTLVQSGTTANAYHYLDSSAGYIRALRMRTGTSDRWIVGTNNDAESGSDAGSNFQVTRYVDGGTSSTALQITRSNGRVTIGAAGSTGGLELGSSGPRIMSGTGAPSFAAPVGSVYTQTDANSTYGNLTGLKWMKHGTNDADWSPDFEGRWISYTPTLTASTTNPTNWTQTGFYTFTGKTVHCKFEISANASVTAGSGTYRVAIPQNASANMNNWSALGSAMVFDSSAGAVAHPRISIDAATYITFWYPSTWPATGNTAVSHNTPPFAGGWASGDKIVGALTYQVA